MSGQQKRRVVITGIGMITPLGKSLEETWPNLLAGKSGISRITSMDVSDFPAQIAGEIKDFDPSEFMDKKDAKRYDRFVWFGVAAAKMAWADAGAESLNSTYDKERCGCLFTTGTGGILSIEEQYRNFVDKGVRRISPLTIPKILLNIASGQIAIELGLKGVNYTPVTACAAGTHAVGLALRHIQWGEADCMVAGGSEAAISVLSLGGFGNMSALTTTNNDSPETASKPFDANRDGFVMGEGGGAVILEELEHAKKRGANIYAEVLGYGFTDDAHHITAPDLSADGSTRAIELALADAGKKPEDVDYINAHGTSTPYNDKTESLAITRALGAHASKVKVNSTKSMLGHLLGASGGVEVGVVAKSIKEGKIHGTMNYTTPDPECALDYTPNASQDLEIKLALKNSLGFGGHNVSLALGRYEE